MRGSERGRQPWLGRRGSQDHGVRLTKKKTGVVSTPHKNCRSWSATGSNSVSASYWVGDLGKGLDLAVSQLPNLL